MISGQKSKFKVTGSVGVFFAVMAVMLTAWVQSVECSLVIV